MFAPPLITVQFQWSGIHCWPDAPASHDYLRSPHRHVFKGRAWLEVSHSDRELEFHQVLGFIEKHLEPMKQEGSRSCEMMAEEIVNLLIDEYGGERRIGCEVTEDGENGSIIEWKPTK